ncbi:MULTISPECIES: 16S rRNA (cytosine(967)-C(5))-methyltransferase RsmB [unclassified Gemella]|uniref:16S rRNA (cytosine(967)-C(5))-methyltransferase RsmB n=1 Tax=unclassified Gemella TaxID=2624949 RepID=UPI00107416DA|nr:MULTISPECIES: 16S rRNA (cytosine(967)-C(5))-methyltransferase RsmB [unclassified Gemella]MBF0710154.1 16S rRNA (cytosine(967)-C(5))-methyltransferase RsmB [Gemella sp. GL1.1]MBF0746233.1 16S rRNA (cytosine(967)-C(5))-methyltransferase RsmB [Gemella sp. 19428wG2_WT2a]NYS27498.1 16S rRNA (cytosine(967)-C(5))-methyltransferase RsmB [Gemella sp. GL1]TFU60515.1 16S rRNA (cytosine(967)-C(5))-methyltransferase RsmB [Gemella sp. WT2a]
MNKTAREYAYAILINVFLDDAYSNISINKVFSKNNISSKDKKYITQLVYGSIKNKLYIEHIIKRFSKGRIKPKVRILILMSLYQILKLDKTPDFAAVNEAVKLSKKIFGLHTSKFVNAILRNIIRNIEKIDYVFKDEDEEIIIKYSCPRSLYMILKEQYGKEKAISIVKSFNTTSENSIRINLLKITKSDLINYFEDRGISVKESSVAEDCLLVSSIDITDPKFQEGYYIIQDEASALVAHALEENREKTLNILDVCAAPGGKSLHIASLYNNSCLISCDKYQHKLKLIADNAEKLGITNICIQQQDATELNIEFLNRFDVIICDVPCSGMGVIKNKPEIKYKVDDSYIRKLTDLQLEILENSIKYLKPEGCLIYSTCTIDKRENEYNINRFLEKNPNFNLENIRLSNQFEKIQTGMIKILPDDYNCDGFFICKLRKNSKI